MNRRRQIATWVVAVFAVVGLVAPLALAFASAVGGDDDPESGDQVVGNDVGRPLPVAPDGQIFAGIPPNECSLDDIRASTAVGIRSLDDPIRAVRDLGAPRLFDVWSTSTETLTPPSQAPTAPADRLWVDAGTALPDILDDDEGQTVFGIAIDGDRRGDVYVLAVGRTTDDGFRFDWPCPELLNAEWSATAEQLDRAPDESLAIELLLGE